MSTKRRGDDQADRAIDGMLRQSLGTDSAAVTGGCLEAGLIAAWIDGALSAEERSAAEAHAADCQHCQAMLAAMARSAPGTGPRPWWRGIAVRWLVPATAAGAVLAFWVSAGLRNERSAHQVSATLTAPSNQRADKSPSAAPGGTVERNAAASPERQGQQASVKTAQMPARKDLDANRPIAGGGVTGEPTINAISRNAAASDALAKKSETAQAAAPVSAAAAPPSLPATPSAPKPSALNDKVAVAVESQARRNLQARQQAAAAGASVPIDITSRDPAVRWRLNGPTVLQSTDGGARWTPQSTGTTAALSAGSAPSREVCWIVGQSGTVLLSTDGSTWQIRPFPEAANLTAIRAIDAKTATVTTADGRQFSTIDGGATWSKLPLQEKSDSPF